MSAPAVVGAGTNGSAERAVQPSNPSTPPPEPPSAQWTRRWIILAFWIVVLGLGLPHWLWTTSTYRANLPLEVMNAWSEGRHCGMRFPLHIQLNLPDINSGGRGMVFHHLSKGLSSHSESRPLQYLLAMPPEHSPTIPSPPSLNVTARGGDLTQGQHAKLDPWNSDVDVLYGAIGRTEQWYEELGTSISTIVEELYRDEQLVLAHLLQESHFASDNDMRLDPPTKQDLDVRSTRAFSYATTYHLTFSLFTSGATPSAWDIEDALDRYINPLLAALSKISHFTVDTQVQLHASLSPSIAGPQLDVSSGQWKLQKSDLSGFINAAEWPLNPSIGQGPTINFVLYVPAKEDTPLVLAETNSTSWLIPQWGGVQILNTANPSSTLTVKDLEPVMLTFAEQLTSLIGLPTSPQSMALRIASLTRERAVGLIISASSTLGALSRLTLKLTSIAIPDSVAKAVNITIVRLEEACKDMHEGRFQSALENARIANDEAERAFFEPSMVGQVYFPDEHKVAVYVPLLGPMAVPMVLAALKEIRNWRTTRKAKIT